MNGAHWHLVLNHFPFIGGVFSTIVLLIGYMTKNQLVKTTGLSLIVFTGLITIPAFQSGEGAEDTLEAIGQKNHAMIHPHEEAAELALWVMEAGAALALIALFLQSRKNKASNMLTTMSLVISLVSTGLFMNVNNLGGKIRHTEIREQGAAGAPVNVADSTEEEERR